MCINHNKLSWFVTVHVRTNPSTKANNYELNLVKLVLVYLFVSSACNTDFWRDKEPFWSTKKHSKVTYRRCHIHFVLHLWFAPALRDWVRDKVYCRHVTIMYCSKIGSVWTFHLLLHEVIEEEEKSTSWHFDEMKRLEGQNLDTIRPVLASGAVFVFIFTFQFYRYCKFSL